MPEPLTIYECPEHGVMRTCVTPFPDALPAPACRVFGCQQPTSPVRVFREEDVRPLWEAVNRRRRFGDDTCEPHEDDAFDAFPAPEEWKR